MQISIPQPSQPVIDVKTGFITREWYRFFHDPSFGSLSAAVPLPVNSGGTGLTIGTPGGVLTFTAPLVIASSAALGLSQLVLGGAPGVPSTPVGLGTVTTLLHGNVGGAPSFGSVVLTADVAGVLPEGNGGTNQNTYTLGDTLYSSAANTLAKLSGNTVATRKFLRQTGTGAVSAAPAWDTLLAADVPASALTKTDDTNVTLTLGGAPATALLAAASLTLGWTGTLSIARGGTGNGTGTATVNANLTGPITSVGNATSVAAQTGTGSTFVMQNTPTLTTPVIGAATGTSLSVSGALTTTAGVLTASGTGTHTIAGPLAISGASAGQIVFPATQNASANANTLDDFEKGTFTVTDGSGAALTFSGVTGFYTKIGNQFCFQIGVTYPITASGANAQLNGLPFAIAGADTCGKMINSLAFASSIYITSTQVWPVVGDGFARATNLQLSAAQIFISGQYRTA